MKACFWIDADAAVGAGHATRAQALANALGSHGLRSILFADDVGAVRRAGVTWSDVEPLAGRSFARVCAEQKARIAVIDLPHTRPAAPSALAELVDSDVSLIGFDSSATDPGGFDLWVDAVSDACRPVPVRGRCLHGPRFAVLRAGLVRDDAPFRSRSASLPRVLIGFGAADAANLTARALRALRGLGERMIVDVLVGPLVAPASRIAIEQAGGDLPHVVIHRDLVDPVPLLRKADLGLFGFGNLFLEAAASGLASVLWHPTPEHAEVSARFQAHAPRPFAVDLGAACATAPAALEGAVRALLADRAQREVLSLRAARIVDGRGAERVAAAVAACTEGFS